MSLPFFTCITVTYGRTARLNECIACFLAQDYEGPKEMMVLNTCPQQVLKGEFPGVIVNNLAERPKSLGDARNTAIWFANGTHMVTWDDDDIYLPNHLSTYARVFGDNDWVWLDKHLFSSEFQVRSIVQGSVNVVAFTKAAWDKAGRYASMDCGEDRQFISRLTTQCKGEKIPIAPKDISFIIGWGNGVYHLSGQGDDKPGQTSGFDRVASDLEGRLNAGREPRGEVHLAPSFSKDWPAEVAQFINRTVPVAANDKDVCIVQLGRFGDIINILPVALHIHNNYRKPHMMVSREFASVLDGVSYVTPYVVDLPNDELGQAMKLAKKEFKHVIRTQIWGKGHQQERTCSAYNEESWKEAGFWKEFSSRDWVPLFDRRNSETERGLAAKARRYDQRTILVSLKGVSSPLPGGDSLLQDIINHFGEEYTVLDLGTLKLHRIYDALGILDAADVLVTSDSAMLHLAAASPVPVMALTNPQPWLGTKPRCNWRRNFKYGDSIGNILTAIEESLEVASGFRVYPPVTDPPARRIFHCVERHEETHTKTLGRKLKCQKSWDVLYEQGVVPRHFWQYKRDARDIGDVRALPYLKDVLYFGMAEAGPDDIILWTNDDNFLHPELPALLQYHVGIWGACTSMRCEFKDRQMLSPRHKPHEFAREGHPHIGRDLFAATKSWLMENWKEIPDMILGASDFDLCLAAMVRIKKGIKTSRQNIGHIQPPAELPLGYVAHEWHQAYWQRAENQNSAPSQIHNRKLFREWARIHLPELRFYANNVI